MDCEKFFTHRINELRGEGRSIPVSGGKSLPPRGIKYSRSSIPGPLLLRRSVVIRTGAPGTAQSCSCPDLWSEEIVLISGEPASPGEGLRNPDGHALRISAGEKSPDGRLWLHALAEE